MDEEPARKAAEHQVLSNDPVSEPGSAMDPVLVTPGAKVSGAALPDQEFTFEFDVAKGEGSSSDSDDQEPEMELRKSMVGGTTSAPVDEPSFEEDDQFRKSRERLLRLKSLNYRLGSGSLSELEREPAYKRKNVKLENTEHSSESNISRYTLTTEDEKKTQIRSNNSFLHDNVD